MPQELVCPALGQIAWRDYLDEPLSAGQVRLRALFGAEKHGTAHATINGHANRRGAWDEAFHLFRPGGTWFDYPLPLGNQVVAEVVELGAGVTKRGLGERVMGFAGFRPTLTVAEDWGWALEPSVVAEDALCLDPALFALGAIRDGNVRLGDIVAVTGLGAIGLIAVALLRHSGISRIIVSDPVQKRLDLALRIGASESVAVGGDTGLRFKELTGGRGPDVVLDFSGSMPAMQAALRGVAFGGTIVMAAFPSPWPAGLDFGGEGHMNRPRIVSSRACSDPNPDHPRWDFARLHVACLDLIRAGAIPGKLLIDPVIPLAGLAEAYSGIVLDPLGGIKMGVRYA